MKKRVLSSPGRPSGQVALALVGIIGALGCARSSADDRFIVPVPSSSPSPAPSSPPPSSPASDSSSSASSPTPDSSPSPSYSPSDHRFIVPVPGDRPSRGSGGGYGGGGYGGGYGHGGGRGWHDSYSGGYYYWGGRYYYPDGYYYSPYGNGFGFDPGRQVMQAGQGTSAGGNRLAIFFPPAPPPLDTPVPARPVGEPGLTAPTALEAYVYDAFYAPLSTRLAERNLPDPLRKRLDAYQAAKGDLQAQLHAKLASLSSSGPAATEAALAVFAREQTPRVAALEASAEQLRGAFLRRGLVGVFSGTGDWNEHRTWRLGVGRLMPDRAGTRMEEFRVIRAAVYYQDGLVPAQRRLLRELAMELHVDAYMPNGETRSSEESLVYFSPETARVRFPTDLTTELAAKVAEYQQLKIALKSELRDALFLNDRATPAARNRAMAQLATSQAPRLSLLEPLAEEIRRGLAARPPGVTPAGPNVLPAELAARMGAYHQERTALQEAIHVQLEEISRIPPPTQFKITENLTLANGADILALELRPGVRSTGNGRSVQQAVARFNTEHRVQAATLRREQAAIHAAAAALVAANPALAQGKSVDTLLRDFAVASVQQDVHPLYGDYTVAVFQPGLSPEQRRLLFDAALQKLALPLPGGEWQP